MGNAMMYCAYMDEKELREWRYGKGYTQEKAAAFLSYSISHYRKLEYGQSPISRRVSEYIKATNQE